MLPFAYSPDQERDDSGRFGSGGGAELTEEDETPELAKPTPDEKAARQKEKAADRELTKKQGTEEKQLDKKHGAEKRDLEKQIKREKDDLDKRHDRENKAADKAYEVAEKEHDSRPENDVDAWDAANPEASEEERGAAIDAMIERRAAFEKEQEAISEAIEDRHGDEASDLNDKHDAQFEALEKRQEAEKDDMRKRHDKEWEDHTQSQLDKRREDGLRTDDLEQAQKNMRENKEIERQFLNRPHGGDPDLLRRKLDLKAGRSRNVYLQGTTNGWLNYTPDISKAATFESKASAQLVGRGTPIKSGDKWVIVEAIT